ncbi:hypothetical protein [Endothiovibrio diazotrophicus]
MLELFYAQANNLRFPLLHVVYTIPPFLLPMMPGIGKVFGASVVNWPNLHVRRKDGGDDEDGLKLLEEIVWRRYPKWQEFFSREQLRRLGRATGGDLRDFFRVIRDALIAASVTEDGVTAAIVDQVENRLRSIMSASPAFVNGRRTTRRISPAISPACCTPATAIRRSATPRSGWTCRAWTKRVRTAGMRRGRIFSAA